MFGSVFQEEPARALPPLPCRRGPRRRLRPADCQQAVPATLAALAWKGLDNRPNTVAALATVAVEPAMQAVKGSGTDASHEQQYGGRSDSGNTQPGDGARYWSRGHAQATGG